MEELLGKVEGEAAQLLKLLLSPYRAPRSADCYRASYAVPVPCLPDGAGSSEAAGNRAPGRLAAKLQAEGRLTEKAITAHQDAVAIFRETGDRHGEGLALLNLCNALAGVRRFDEAVTAHQDAAAIFRETGDR